MALNVAKAIREGVTQKTIDGIIQEMTTTPEWDDAYQNMFEHYQNEGRKLVEKFMPEEGVFMSPEEDQEFYFEFTQAVIHRLKQFV